MKPSSPILGLFDQERSFPGFQATVIREKASLRIVQNADIVLKDCFVPDSHKLKPGGFSGNTKLVLESSRALVAAACTGLLFGAFCLHLRGDAGLLDPFSCLGQRFLYSSFHQNS